MTLILLGLAAAGQARAADVGERSGAEASMAGTFASHPAAGALAHVFAAAAEDRHFTPSDLSRRDYVSLLASDVDFFAKFQNADGAIIDPYRHEEVQYATPAFALAAAFLVHDGGRQDLLQPASRALSCAITALCTHHAANGHSDFYIPLIILARRSLKDAVPADLLAHWDEQLRQIDIATTYNAKLRGMNWNIVSSCGELLRRQDGLVRPDQMGSQMQYLETSLAGHESRLTRFGMYEDPGVPLAYDEFARIWLDEMMASNAYDGKYAEKMRSFLSNGALSTLLLLSPTGEWASGGRSAFHNWNEAPTIFICEIHANEWKRAGRADVAGAFKRAAHLALMSMRRWQRPGGDLWIIKNRADPAVKFAYETYSEHSQYNLLPMAMLAMAYQQADDSIAERPTPAEVGGYVFDLRDIFHKVVAAAGGYYVLIDTAADPHYNATGLQRVQRSGVDLSPLSDSTAAERAYSAKSGEKLAMTPGLQWQLDNNSSHWTSLADYSGQKGAAHAVTAADLSIGDCSPAKISFDLNYHLSDSADSGVQLSHRYTITSDGVMCEEALNPPARNQRLLFPALVNDGAHDLHATISGDTASIDDDGSVLMWKVLSPPSGVTMKLEGPRVICHNGYMQSVIATWPATGKSDPLRWQIHLENMRLDPHRRTAVP